MATGAAFSFSTADSKLVNVQNVSMGAGASVTLTGQTEAFTITGGGGAETIISSSGDDVINGGLGDDFIQAAAGADVINGGAGSDTVSYADVTGATAHGEAAVTGMAVNFSGESIADADITAVMGTGIVTGNADPDALLAVGTVQYLTGTKGTTADAYSIDTVTSVEGFVGSALNDYIVLGADAVTVDAGAGADAIFSGTAADNIDAGAGADVINIGAASDHGAGETITGGDGADTIRFNSVLGQTLVLSANVTGVETAAIASVDGTATGTTAENIDASALTAGIALVGNGGNNSLTGSAFADTFAAGLGNDRMIVDDADTSVDGEGGADTMVLAANATFTATQLLNVETAELASGVALTVDHTDVLDTDNLATVNGVNDAATETLIVNGAALGVIATKDFGGLTLNNVSFDYRGGVGSDNITGTSAADVISGGFGVDILNGNGGSDTLTGGEGSDTFTVEGNDSRTNIVVITDFEATAAGDTLNLVNSDITAASGAVGTTRQDIDGGPVTRADGVTIESFSVTATGEVTLFDTNTALGTTTSVFAQTAADVVAITEALHLNIGVANVVTFGLDADANGTAESTIVASVDLTTGETNIVELSNLAFGANLAAAAGPGVINISASAGAAVPTENADTLTGTANADSIDALGGNDTIDALGGNDTIDGGAGDDQITGGDGNDQITGGAGADTFNIAFGGEGEDTIAFVAADDIIDFTGASNVADTATGGEVTVNGFQRINFSFGNTTIGDGITVISNSSAASLAVADVATFLEDIDPSPGSAAITGYNDDEVQYIAVDNGTNTAIFQYSSDGGFDTIAAGELTLIVTLTGVTTGQLSAANFADFV